MLGHFLDVFTVPPLRVSSGFVGWRIVRRWQYFTKRFDISWAIVR